MKKYEGVIFDLDGTLLDTITDLADSVNEVLSLYGHPHHSYADYKLKIGKGFRNLLEVSFPKGSYTEAVIDEALERFVEIYDRKYMDKTKPYEGIVLLLEKLLKKGIKIGVNSNKRTDYTNALVDKYFPDVPFVEVFGERANIPKKPDPAAALELAKLMELDPERIVYIGDTKTDITTGKNAGMDTIGVLWGFRDYDELKSYGADYIVGHPKEIEEVFDVL